MSNSASSVLSVARGEIGYCRFDDPAAGTKYGRWYAQSHGSYYGQSGVPFCAMFVSWVFSQAGASCAGLPAAYCPYILNAARGAGNVLADKTKAQTGDVVLFDWDGGVVDHVGIVELNKGSYIQTIEGNTTINGRSGSVGRRTRAWSTVAAIVRPRYGSEEDEVTEQDKKDIAYQVWHYINSSITNVDAYQRQTDMHDALTRKSNDGHDNPAGHNLYGRINIIEHNLSLVMYALGIDDSYRAVKPSGSGPKFDDEIKSIKRVVQ